MDYGLESPKGKKLNYGFDIKGFLMETIASIKGAGDSEFPSSVHKVVSSEDLLIEILVRLPVISLHLFRVVSKWWLSLITSPKFITRRSQIPSIDPISGFFLRGNRSSDEYGFLPLDIRIPANSYRLKPPASEGRTFKILDSCNGLLLCCTNMWTIYVYNPSIKNMFKMLPKDDYMFMNLNSDYISGGSKMAFDPTKSPYYKVVNAQFMNANCRMIQIQIYSSETSNWTVIDDRFDPIDFDLFSKGIYWNDAIHWLDCSNGQILHHKLYLEYQANTNIDTHVPLDDMVDSSYVRLFESRGCLLFVTMVDAPVLKMNVYEMSNDNSRWSVKYCVTVDEGWRTPSNIGDSFGVLSIMLGEREEDSFLVMFLDGKVVRYNFVSQNVSTLTNYGSSSPPLSFPFIASLAHV